MKELEKVQKECLANKQKIINRRLEKFGEIQWLKLPRCKAISFLFASRGTVIADMVFDLIVV